MYISISISILISRRNCVCPLECVASLLWFAVVSVCVRSFAVCERGIHQGGADEGLYHVRKPLGQGPMG